MLIQHAPGPEPTREQTGEAASRLSASVKSISNSQEVIELIQLHRNFTRQEWEPKQQQQKSFTWAVQQPPSQRAVANFAAQAP